MPKNSCCCLSSLNLSEFVINPYTDSSKFDMDGFKNAVHIGIRALDKLIEENAPRHPLKEQREMSLKYRNVGLGVFGYATALMKLGIKYGSKECLEFSDQIFYQMFREAVKESNCLAYKNGPFPGYKECVWDSRIIKAHFSQSEIEEMKPYGLRNSSLLSVAPTGCQVGSTLIATDKGLLRLDEIVESKGEQWQDRNDYIAFQENGENVISKGYVNGYAPTQKITLSNGIVMEATHNHLYKVIRNGESIWCRTDEIQIGDIVPSKIGYYNNENDFRLKSIELQNYHGNNAPIVLPDKITEKLAFILGAYYGNGSNHYNGRQKKFQTIRFSMNQNKPNDICKLCNYIYDIFKIFPRQEEDCRNHVMQICISNVNLCRWLEENGLKKQAALSIRVPYAIRCSSVASIKAFVEGYYMCDGSHNGNTNTYYIDTASYFMAQDLAVMLRAIGVNSRIRVDTKRKGAKSKNPMYRIYMGGFKSLDFPKEKERYVSKEEREILCNVKELMGNNFIFDRVSFIEDSVAFTLDIEVQNEHHYLANGLVSHNSLSSLLNCSGGLEPEFAISFTRRTVGMTDNQDKYYTVYCGAAKEYMAVNHTDKLPDYFISSQDIDWRDRIKVQAVMQKHIDTAISSTVNLKNSATKEDVAGIYLEAWRAKLKGITVFRDGCKRLGILTTSSTPKKEETIPTFPSETQYFNVIKPISRKKMGVTHGDTYCKKCACGTLYITVNRDDNGNLVELFVHTSKGGICQANISALTRLASLSLRSGVLVDEVIDQLKAISCPACNVTKAKGKPIDGMSCPDIISRVLQSAYDKKRSAESSLKAVGRLQEEAKELPKEAIADAYKCPECGSALTMSGGCRTCLECGWSKCE